ncbi:MAG: hypothetical protein ACOCV4_09245 [Myxococcota bacterium]
MVRRGLALVTILAVTLPLALAQGGPVIAEALHEADHVCACPLDSEGHCRCPECFRLDVHGDRAAGRLPAREGSPVPLLTSHCGDPEAPPSLLPVPRAAMGEAWSDPVPPPPRTLPRSDDSPSRPEGPDLDGPTRPPSRA